MIRRTEDLDDDVAHDGRWDLIDQEIDQEIEQVEEVDEEAVREELERRNRNMGYYNPRSPNKPRM